MKQIMPLRSQPVILTREEKKLLDRLDQWPIWLLEKIGESGGMGAREVRRRLVSDRNLSDPICN